MESCLFSMDMQKLLLKEQRKCGELKFILSRATEETSRFIDELLEAITSVAKKYNLYNIKLFCGNDSALPYEIPSNIFADFTYFVLNTNFTTRHLFTENITVSHLLDVWPTISPYLFIQIIWHMKLDDLLIESLMHMPLDICVEILEATVRCLNEQQIVQNRRFVFLLISKLYYKCKLLNVNTVSKRDIVELANQLVAHFQALLDIVSSKFIKSSDPEKYTKHGILLKDLLRCVKTCMSYKSEYYEENNAFLRELNITYGSFNNSTAHLGKFPIDKVQAIVEELNQELFKLLQDQIEQIDCFEFIEWAEVDDEENVMISLQRAIIIECHCFMEFMKRDEILNENLFHCLQQIVGSNKPAEEHILSIEEICYKITNSQLDKDIVMRELMERYKKWDLIVLNLLNEKAKLLDIKDFSVLLKYLHYIFSPRSTNMSDEAKHQAYILVLKILMQKRLSIMYHTVLQYTVQHFHDNRLTCLFNSEVFKKFIESNINMHDQEKLRCILIFVMLNPKVVLTTLVRVMLGSSKPEYRNVMFKKPQLAYLHTFLTIKLDEQNSLLTYLLNDAWLNDHSTWHYKQFESFMNDMLETEAITPDELINNVYILFLSTDVFNSSNLLSVLTHINSILEKKKAQRKHNASHTVDKTNYTRLIISLTKKMSTMRKCSPMYSRDTVNYLLDCGTRILNLIFATIDQTPSNWNEIIRNNHFTEPIDQILVPLQLRTMLRGTVIDVIQNYERRCKYQPQHSSQLDRRAFLRHMMLHATEAEYQNFALEMTTMSSAYFGWTNELIAYETILQITTEAMQLALAYTDIFPRDTFVSLLRRLLRYCSALSCLKQKEYKEAIYDVLLKTLFALKSIVGGTQYDKMYNIFLEHIDKMYKSDEIAVYFLNLKELIEVYFVQSEESDISDKFSACSTLLPNETLEMFVSYQGVCTCIDTTS
ncbi:PREDICTED: uncharacterized protein LOC105567570 [Vollenhovia emeryi]|uniref:uncharacterized protein LOC105567570 n=1 Tax=Vollenhovia emeryi TaxID=411798 RepID=UPI0005F55EAA|nr:PREDICTED: uncharacterized protein LOC105567570 [Vollenhovia emeryi]XP_011877908.1 PREDICTED: uncharacterized protein LOC105567570 [Vollenhovia emeryi]